jgi:ATP-dependent DNA helicase RecQ
MMMSDFQNLQNVLDGWPETIDGLDGTNSAEDPIYDRIYQIFLTAQNQKETPSFPDLMVLFRQILMLRRYTGSPSDLRVQMKEPWPSPAEWECHGFDCSVSSQRYILSPRSWHPTWLVGNLSDREDIFSDEFAKSYVQKNAEVPIDPFLKKLIGHNTYVCPGQREAIRSVLFMPVGSTLIVNLPTGGGKTTVAQVPFLMDGLNNGLTLFIVPTTALAIDQERRMKELLSLNYQAGQIPPMAWHSGLTEVTKSTVKKNIRSGSQGILFVSPEAVTQALLPAIFDANKSGYLKYLIIDEVHLVSQWGDSFRPAFQALSGLRRGLLACCGGEAFRTILMSATLSPQTVETLDVLFGPPNSLQMVSAVHLRPEPRYWTCKVGTDDEKKSKVLEVLKRVPRPFILYVTRPKEAEEWTRILKQEAGYCRLESFHGDTPNSEREKIIEKWNKNELDGIVATSAFGVGMDKSDVRSIIHATVPESLDRFYQEVGRGGRDGTASLSVSIYSERDVKNGRELSQSGGLSVDNAFTRWSAMFSRGKKFEGDDLVAVSLNVVPSHLNKESDYNAKWNLATLIMMARTGMIELESVPPNVRERRQDEKEEDFEERTRSEWDEFYTTVAVRTLDPQHLNEYHFRPALEIEQKYGREVAKLSFDSLVESLEGRQEIGDALSKLYTNHKPERTVIVSRVCRGCPAEQTNRFAEIDYQIPPGMGIDKLCETDVSAWMDDFPYMQQTAVIFYPAGEETINQKMEDVFAVLIQRYGIREISAEKKHWDAAGKLHNLHEHCPDRILVASSGEDGMDTGRLIPLPRVTLLLPWQRDPIPIELVVLQRPLHVIIAPDDIEGDYPHKRRIETDPYSITISDFLRVANQ